MIQFSLSLVQNRVANTGTETVSYYLTEYANEKQWNMINDTCKEIDKAYIENMNYKIV